MFLPTNETHLEGLPRSCTFSVNDWNILASFWHPVAFSSEIEHKPVKVRLLDLDLVVYRTVDGIAAARDLCVHRGAALSLGWLDDERKNIVCPFHGLHYDNTGRCTRIPSLPDSSMDIPNKIRLVSYQAVERYGLVWVCLKDDPLRPIPKWPHLEKSGPPWRTFEVPQGHWNASASRHTENFCDVAHLSWVHMRTFGNRKRPEIPSYDLERTENGLKMKIPYTEVMRLHFDKGEDAEERTVFYTKELIYPFANELTIEFTPEDGDTQITRIFDVGTPISARETAIFQLIQTNIQTGEKEDFVKYQMVTNSEDVPFVESQKPEEVPLNIAAELHIPADKFSIQYRRDLSKVFGLGAPVLTS